MTEDDLAFIQHLQSTGYVDLVPMGDGRWVGLLRLMYHWTMHIGQMGDRDTYDDRFCYATYEKAKEGLTEWAARDFMDEPEGWHRHPKTARRRVDGDPTTEYIAT